MDWEWIAFLEPIADDLSPKQAAAQSAGFQHVDRVTCPYCSGVAYSLWVFTGTGPGAPSLNERRLRARAELEKLLIEKEPEHPAIIESK